MRDELSLRRHRKAQSAAFEQVILFSIGMTIFVMCFAVFNIYQGYFNSVSMNDQLEQMKTWVSSNIINLIQNGDANSSMILDIPRKIGDEEYEIQLLDSQDFRGINVTSLLTHKEKKSQLFGLGNEYTLSGKVQSTGRRFIIYKKGNEIIIS